ncbi:MAG: alpha/beta hydrolase-fold protein, partial [Ferruginibacter sp.]
MEKIFKILVFALWLFPVCSNGQVQVRLTVKQISLTHPNDSLYIAGDFNSWSAGDKDFVFAKDNQGNLFINLDLPAGLHEYKLTRGSWSSVETTVEGDPIANRVLALSRDSQLTILVRAWADDFKRMPVVRKHTATAQVSILDSAFDIPQLNAKRRIWVYLPENYASTKKRYPVLYMQDGQNLFDETSSGFG